MGTFAHYLGISRARLPGRRPTRGVSVAVGPARLGDAADRARAAATAAALGSAGPAFAGETVSPLPILMWIAAPLLVAGGSVVVAYVIDLVSRRLRRLLNPERSALHRELIEP